MKKLNRKQEYELLKECVADCSHCDRLILHYWDLVYHTVKKTFLMKSAAFTKEDLDDMRNEVFLRLFEKKCHLLRQYREDGGLQVAGWIVMISAQTVKMYLRKNDRIGKLGGDLMPLVEELERDIDPIHEFIRIEIREMLLMAEDCIEELPYLEKLVLKLHFMEGYSLTDTACFLQKTKNNVYQIKHRAIKNLKELMLKRGAEFLEKK